jgi:predicted nucleic acid-binding protein
MIVVDSSVWIAHLRSTGSVGARKLGRLEEPQDIIVGDIILMELLQGARDERHAAAIEYNLRQLDIRPMLGDHIAVAAARNYRLLRDKGITPRKTNDLIIGTYCIENGHSLLHEDRDFDPMEQHLGLKTV